MVPNLLPSGLKMCSDPELSEFMGVHCQKPGSDPGSDPGFRQLLKKVL